MVFALVSISSFALKPPVSSSRPNTIGIGTPSGIGIIFTVEARRRACCAARRPPDTPP